MTGLDTSVVVRLLTGQPADQSARATDLLDKLFEAGQKAKVSDLVVSETYFALQCHYHVPKAEALAVLKGFLESSEIEASDVALAVLDTPKLASAKPGFVDRLIHLEYFRSVGTMATFEKKAAKLEGTTVL